MARLFRSSLLCLASLALLALPVAADDLESAEVSPLTGTWQVEGVTVEVESGQRRRITGTVVFQEKDGSHTASFALQTRYPTPDGPLPADLIGNADVSFQGRKLTGRTETQLVMATVPGVDVDFAFVPRFVGPRIASRSHGEIGRDGSLVLEVESEALPGERYSATRTKLRGQRIPDVATGP